MRKKDDVTGKYQCQNCGKYECKIRNCDNTPFELCSNCHDLLKLNKITKCSQCQSYIDISEIINSYIIEILSAIKIELSNSIYRVISYHDNSDSSVLCSQSIEASKILEYLLQFIIDFYTAQKSNDLTTCKASIFQLFNSIKNIDYISDNFWNNCESPIENLLYAALIITKPEKLSKSTVIRSQVPVCNEKYTLDMAICTFNNKNFDSDFKVLIGIECDGYTYHYDTHEKIRKTNERINEIKMYEKIEIFQYDGSSIYENCIEIANKIWTYIISKFNDDVIW